MTILNFFINSFLIGIFVSLNAILFISFIDFPSFVSSRFFILRPENVAYLHLAQSLGTILLIGEIVYAIFNLFNYLIGQIYGILKYATYIASIVAIFAILIGIGAHFTGIDVHSKLAPFFN
eukprot:TRINITY_DN358_c0_g1_i1.p1 TRINITY_DN358_c0_g1~~TRINITY_DN358_c0_g1_i1.p1  ORF type:complete len:121 (-),score=41.43 TRINITY_DN358_c0_g1_i1:87-449(-)